jgi:hypothetical protein
MLHNLVLCGFGLGLLIIGLVLVLIKEHIPGFYWVVGIAVLFFLLNLGKALEYLDNLIGKKIKKGG